MSKQLNLSRFFRPKVVNTVENIIDDASYIVDEASHIVDEASHGESSKSNIEDTNNCTNTNYVENDIPETTKSNQPGKIRNSKCESLADPRISSEVPSSILGLMTISGYIMTKASMLLTVLHAWRQ